MGILSVNLNNINLDNNFDEDNPIIILIRLLASHSKFKTCKALKRWWDFCMSKDEKKEIVPMFTE